jgi:glycosyltransferase involved in cell wall biosynthesis
VTISLYTAMRNCIENDYPFVEMLRHHLPLTDEIIVNEGYSTDGTYEAIRDLDPKIKIFRNNWEKPKGEAWWIHFKDAARRQCSGDWCIHLDCDEFIPEWEFDAIRSHLATTSDVLIPTRFTNFYGNYRVYHPNPAKIHWITGKMIIHRNLPDDIEFWGDGSNVKLKGEEFTWNTSKVSFSVHHFGGVRYAGRLRQAWWSQGRFRTGRSIWVQPPQFVFDLFPLKWADPDFIDDLAIYEGPTVKAVRDDPDRFARDKYYLFKLLSEKKANGAVRDRIAQ